VAYDGRADEPGPARDDDAVHAERKVDFTREYYTAMLTAHLAA
jgi:hypothetical protein